MKKHHRKTVAISDPILRKALFSRLFKKMAVIDEGESTRYAPFTDPVGQKDEALTSRQREGFFHPTNERNHVTTKSDASTTKTSDRTARNETDRARIQFIRQRVKQAIRARAEARKFRRSSKQKRRAVTLARSPAVKSPSHTDAANAERLIASCGNSIRYCSDWGKWVSWNGRKWNVLPDEKEIACRFLDTINEYIENAETPSDRNFGISSKSAQKVKAALYLASASRRLTVRADQFDRDPWIINVQNGSLNLKTGELTSHERAYLCTKMAAVKYDPESICPLWIQFLTTAMNGNLDLVNMLQRIAGYCMTGDVSEQALFFFFGEGRNGKSTFLSTMQTILGEYSQMAPRGLLESDRSNDHDTRIARLYRARLVIGSEVEAGKHIAESLVKDLTGGERIAARRMREDYWEFDPTHKIVLAGNHQPVVVGDDLGFWRRMKLIPWTRIISDEEVDIDFKSKLLAEMDGIFHWAAQGAYQWATDGLGLRTELVAHATDSYRKEQRDIRDMSEIFMKFCVHELMFEAYVPGSRQFSFWCTTEGLYRRYCAWSKANDHVVFKQGDLTKFLRKEMNASTQVKWDKSTGRSARVWVGVQIRPDEDPSQDDVH
jgi:P4 family phage/plasmid primase-like protien